MDEPRIINDTLPYKLVLIFGGVGFITFGISELLGFRLPERQISDLIVAMLFLIVGIVCIFVYLDQRAIILSKDRIEIKSFFRKRVIFKKDITGYGVENYKLDYWGKGERIRIFSKEKNIKVFTTQYKTIKDVKEFVRGKKELSTKVAFKRERIEVNIISGIVILGFFCWAGYSINNENVTNQQKGELEGFGVPIVLGNSYEIISDNGNEITFRISEYRDYIFKVDKENTPYDLKNIKTELIVFFDNKENAQKLSNYKNSDLDEQIENPKIIYADEIIVLEDLQPKENK